MWFIDQGTSGKTESFLVKIGQILPLVSRSQFLGLRQLPLSLVCDPQHQDAPDFLQDLVSVRAGLLYQIGADS